MSNSVIFSCSRYPAPTHGGHGHGRERAVIARHIHRLSVRMPVDSYSQSPKDPRKAR
ncbi:hypothetical protein HMPREF0043_01835 [Actinobaculum sp. oral taxon 183 str. F0552]|nr:hypothetical protein HMPREF0043_01835 [Actinobaculum sp. oral taxon 183 str. F0552]